MQRINGKYDCVGFGFTPLYRVFANQFVRYAYEFAEDHLITRDIVVELGDYDREFVRRDRIAYPWGKDFQTHDKEHRRRVSVEPGFPDHAIVKGYLSTEKDQKK